MFHTKTHSNDSQARNSTPNSKSQISLASSGFGSELSLLSPKKKTQTTTSTTTTNATSPPIKDEQTPKTEGILKSGERKKKSGGKRNSNKATVDEEIKNNEVEEKSPVKPKLNKKRKVQERVEKDPTAEPEILEKTLPKCPPNTNHVELKDDLLADWSEDESELVNTSAVNTNNVNQVQMDTDKILEVNTKQETESVASKEIVSAVPSPTTTTKYRNIPKKDRGRDLIFKEIENSENKTSIDESLAVEVNGDVTKVVVDVEETKLKIETENEMKESENNINNAEKPDVSPDDISETKVPVDEKEPEMKPGGESIIKDIVVTAKIETENMVPITETCNQSSVEENDNQESSVEVSESNVELSTSATSKASEVFDFQEDEDLELAKSPPRRQRQRKSVVSSIDSHEGVDKYNDIKDTEIKMEIENLLKLTSPPKLPEIPNFSRLSSNDDTDTENKLKLDIIDHKDRALPPKERGKRIFKSKNRNRITIESEMDIIRKDIIESSGGDIGIVANRNYRTESDLQIAETLINIPVVLSSPNNQKELSSSENDKIISPVTNSQDTSTSTNDANMVPVPRKKHLQAAFKAEEEKNLENTNKTIDKESSLKSTATPSSLSPKQKFVLKLKEEQFARFEVRVPKKRKLKSNDVQNIFTSDINQINEEYPSVLSISAEHPIRSIDADKMDIENDLKIIKAAENANENDIHLGEQTDDKKIVNISVKVENKMDVIIPIVEFPCNKNVNESIDVSSGDNVFDINNMPIVLSNEPITSDDIDKIQLNIVDEKNIIISPTKTASKTPEKVSRKSKKTPKKTICSDLYSANPELDLIPPVKSVLNKENELLSKSIESEVISESEPDTIAQTAVVPVPNNNKRKYRKSSEKDSSTDNSISPPKRQIISAQSGGQIVITSKGQLITTNTSTTSTAQSIDSTASCTTSTSTIDTTNMKVEVQSHIIYSSDDKVVKSKRSKDDKHKLIRMSQQKLAEMTKLGFIKEKPQGKVLTSSGYKRMQEQLNKKKMTKEKSQVLPESTNSAPAAPETPQSSTPTPPSSPAKLAIKSPKKDICPKDSTKGSIEVEQPSPVQQPTPIETPSPVNTKNQIASAPTEVTENYFACAAETFGGPPNSFYLCRIGENNQYIPIDNRALYLDAFNQLVEEVPEHLNVSNTDSTTSQSIDFNSSANSVLSSNNSSASDNIITDINQLSSDMSAQTFIINTGDGQQIILDQQSLLSFASGEMPHLITADGQQIILQGSPQEIISALVNQQELGILSGMTF